MEINNALMDYPLEWRQVFVTVFFYDIILKFSKTVKLGFSNPPAQILLVFWSRKIG